MNFHLIKKARLLIAVSLFLCPHQSHAALCFCLKSINAQMPFQLKISLPNEDWKQGTAQYKGNKEKIKIEFAGSEELEHYEGRPSYMQYTWHEIGRGKVTGAYVLCIQGAMIYDSWYLRLRDHKKFPLERIIPDDECNDCI